MFAEKSLNERLVWLAGFVEKTVLACRTPMAPLRLLLPLPNCFLRNVCPQSLQLSLIFLHPEQPGQFLSKQFSTNNQPFDLQLERLGYKKKYCSCLNNLYECTKSPSKLSTKSCINWNLYLI